MFKHLVLLLISVIISINNYGHSISSSYLLMDIKSNGIEAELKIPLEELQLAVTFDVTFGTQTLVQQHGQELSQYILAHIHPKSYDGSEWIVKIKNMSVIRLPAGHKELKVNLWFQPPQGKSPRKFSLYYDAIIHQVTTHKVLVSVRRDWNSGKIENEETQTGVISFDFERKSVVPLQIDLGKGSNWKGMMSMIKLGIHHISEGTDHLLFLLVLLLPATLTVKKGKWAGFGGTKYSLLRLINIATAFTIGHSVTLILGALGWVKIPQQPVEVFIAITILITAVHALRPLFPSKEIYVASSFGLVHGLAFATVLSDLNLEPGKMALSILGFNVGIELMQLFVILITVPWLIILSNKSAYKWLRIVGAVIAMIAALAWTAERILLRPNFISEMVKLLAKQSKWIVLGLAIWALISFAFVKNKEKNISGS